MSDPPLPNVVIEPLFTPWKPAMTTIFFILRSCFILFAFIPNILAVECALFVLIPACQPVYATESLPRSLRAMDNNEILICSPDETSKS